MYINAAKSVNAVNFIIYYTLSTHFKLFVLHNDLKDGVFSVLEINV